MGTVSFSRWFTQHCFNMSFFGAGRGDRAKQKDNACPGGWCSVPFFFFFFVGGGGVTASF